MTSLQARMWSGLLSMAESFSERRPSLARSPLMVACFSSSQPAGALSKSQPILALAAKSVAAGGLGVVMPAWATR